jgi:hypothetical protein
MSEDNNGNRNSIKPVRSKLALKNVKKQLPDKGQEKVKGERENNISETKTSIDPFGVKTQKKIIKKNTEKHESINYFKR